jgi:VWFA-related protein
MSRVRSIVLLVFFIIGLGFPGKEHVAKAQDEHWEIRINQFSTLEGPDAMNLKAYFSIYDDRSGSPMLIVDAQSAQVTLLNTNYTSNGELKKPDIPIYITLLLDASGSMARAADAIQEAAKLSLNDTPDNAYFSVVQFNEDISLLQDFTENISAISFAIDRYQVANKGTCFYDAGYTAVEALQKAPQGRRAIIMFADGIDETFEEGKQCSKHTYQEVLDFAESTQVPINTIGLTAQETHINEVELKGLAISTGGFSAIASQGDLTQAFQSIMQRLKAQWMFEAPIYPRRGNNDAVLNITLKDGASLSQAFAINSNTDYPGPPSPVTASLAGLLLKAAQQSYEVQLNVTAPELVDYIRIEIWDQDAGSKVGEYVFKELAANNQFLVPTEALITGRKYELRILAISKQDQTPFELFRDDQGKPSTQLVHSFAFDPSSAYPSLQVQSLVQKSGDLILTVNVTNSDLVGGFDGWLIDENTNTQVLNSSFTAPAITGSTGTIAIPTKANRIKDGKYTVVVRVLAKNNNVYSTAVYEGVSYKAPSLFERLGVALIAAPIFLFGILGIILAVVAFLMFNSSRQKSLSGTPVLQGRLGGKLSGNRKSTGPVIPVADQEPIPSRKMPSASQPSSPVVAPSQAAATPPQPSPASPRPAAVVQPSADATVMASNMQGAEAGATVIASSPLMPRATLTVVEAGGSMASKIPTVITPLPFVIGRTEGALLIPDPNISRKHAQISYDPTLRAYLINDMNSSNGTYINSKRIMPGQTTQLSNGMVIGLGPSITLRFELS